MNTDGCRLADNLYILKYISHISPEEEDNDKV
jgi:hypothetical protein